MNGLTNDQYVALRIKLLEPLIATASKMGIEKSDPVITKAADDLWGWVVKGLEPPVKENSSSKKTQSPSKA